MTLTALLLAAGSGLLAGCGSAAASSPPVTSASTLPAGSVPVDAAAPWVAGAVPASARVELTGAETEDLLWMREEEKLARDVYLAMFDLWGIQTFERIAASEDRHMEVVRRLIEVYDLEDPVTEDAPGVFSNPELAALYATLVEQGSESPVAALTVGATIEDLDILDLEEALAATGRADIRRVYENLRRGSVSHLRAFTSRLGAEGADYQPVHHTEDELAALLDDPAGSGRAHRGR